jgi:hypothetical protein
MAGSWRISLGVLASFLFVIPSARAFTGGYTPCPSYYYMPTPYYYYSPKVTVIPLDQSCDSIPVPAPPSPTNEPPLRSTSEKKASLDPRAPVINTTRSLGGSPSTSSKDRCKVGFWNLTGRDVTLTIAGKSWTVARNRTITLDLEHEFSWQTNEGPQQAERVPDGNATHEVVIRE